MEIVNVQPAARPVPTSLFHLLWWYRRRLAIGALCGIVIGVGIALIKPKTYTSSATLLFPAAPASRLSMLSSGNGELPSIPLLDGVMMVPQTGSSAGTAGLIINSRQVRQDVVADLNLKKEWHCSSDLDAFRHFDRNLICKTGKNGELYIGFRDHSDMLAHKIAEELVNQLAKKTEDLGFNPADRSFRVLEEQVKTAEQNVERAKVRLMKFQEQTHLIDAAEQAKALAERYTQLEDDLTAAKLDASTSMRQANLIASNAARLVQACIDPVPGPTNTLGPLYQKMIQAESDLALLRERLTPEHPDYQEKKNAYLIAKQTLELEIKRQLSALKSGSSPVVSNMVVQAAAAQAKVAGLQVVLNQTAKEVASLPKAQAVYLQLQAELDARVDILKMYQSELEKSRIVKETRIPPYQVLDEADIPLSADPSGRSLLVALLFLLGVAAAAIKPVWEWFLMQEGFPTPLQTEPPTEVEPENA